MTGISWFNAELAAKNLALLHELVPGAGILALLVNPNDPDAGTQLADVHVAARDLGRQLVVLKAGTAGEIDAAFASLVQQRAAALVVTTNPFYLNRRDQIVALAARYAIPAIYSNRDFTAAGGFMSYGNNLMDVYRRNGIYVGRILKGDKPSDLPVDAVDKVRVGDQPQDRARLSGTLCHYRSKSEPTRYWNEAARVHHAAWRRGGSTADRRASAAAGNAGDRLSQQHIPRRIPAHAECIP